MNSKTIVALATPMQNCAIHIIRVSGYDCYKIVQRISKQEITKSGYEIQKVDIVDCAELVDQVLLMKFVEPRSFTGEDTIEINCHGGVFVAKKIIDLLLKSGGTYANTGEFSQRALFNNKLKLSELESINNLIHAKNGNALKMAINGMDKQLSNKIDNIAQELFMLIGKIEVNIDYPEYDDVELIDSTNLIKYLNKVQDQINYLIDNSIKARTIRHGFNIALIGEPNVGKSSILNNLLGEEKAIVSNIAGTTRDIVEGSINYRGLTFNFYDTAGLREKASKLEKIGIDKTNNQIKRSDLILLIHDGSKISTDGLQKFDEKNTIVIYNKSDICNKKNIKNNKIFFSAFNDNSNFLLELIYDKIQKNNLLTTDLVVLQSERQINMLKAARDSIDFIKSMSTNHTTDLVVEQLKETYKAIKFVNNDLTDIDMLDGLFKHFCLGK